MLIRSGMRIGDALGTMVMTRAMVPEGASRIGCMKRTLSTSTMVTGMDACCASSWLLTIAPTAANSDA